MSTYDVAAILADMAAVPKVESSAGPIALTDEQVDVWRQALQVVGTTKFPIPASLLAVTPVGDERNGVSNLAKALRARLCKAEGGDGSFIWISGYRVEADPADPNSQPVLMMQAREKVSQRSDAYKRLRGETPAKVEKDGTPIGDWHKATQASA